MKHQMTPTDLFVQCSGHSPVEGILLVKVKVLLASQGLQPFGYGFLRVYHRKSVFWRISAMILVGYVPNIVAGFLLSMNGRTGHSSLFLFINHL